MDFDKSNITVGMVVVYLLCKTKIIPTGKEVSGQRKQKGMILWQEKIIEEEI